MDQLDDLFKEPETLKEKLEDLWFDISYCYPRNIRDFWWGLKNFVKNFWRYRKVLWGDHDFDFDYLNNLIYLKLEWMAKYFRISRIAVGNERRYEEICWALKIADIAFEREDYGEGVYWFPGYVNEKTILRWAPQLEPKDLDRMKEDPDFKAMVLSNVRHLKARYLLFTILDRYSEGWWD